MTWQKEVDVCYCVVKKLELSTEYFRRYCKKLLHQFLIYVFQDTQLQALIPSWYGRWHFILLSWSFWTLQCIFKWGMEIFCLGEYDLFDLFNMYCKVWKWHDGRKWMFATVLWRNRSLAVNILEDIAKSCCISFCFIYSKILNCKLWFLHDMVDDTSFYHCGHFGTLQCIFKWGNGNILFGWIWSFWPI